jgi:VIT1/CCC1 family predicted Fe2+/Mn2+ transporter
MERAEVQRFRSMLAAERRSADLYAEMADAASGDRRNILTELAEVERRHAAHWQAKLTELGEQVPEPGRRGMRVRLLSWLAHRLSIDAVLPYLERAEHADAGLYRDDPDAAAGMSLDERSHARVLTRLRSGAADQGRPLVREPWHRGDRSGALRAAVFGVNDGLVSNTSLVMGFAGSGAGASVILFAGLAGLLAGAFSMAAGEYISMRSQREAYEHEIAVEELELRYAPEAEVEELALIYRAKGLDREEAQRVATTIMGDRATALNTMAREELGLDPDDLGSPWSAAISSLVSFAVGASVVVLPYIFATGVAALAIAVLLAAIALFTVGAVLGMLTGRGGFRCGVRQLAIGGGAAVLIFAIGHVGAALTGTAPVGG